MTINVSIASTIGAGKNALSINPSEKTPGYSSVTGVIYECEGVVKKTRVTNESGLGEIKELDISASFLNTTLTLMVPNAMAQQMQQQAAIQQTLSGNVIGLTFVVSNLKVPNKSIDLQGNPSYTNVCTSVVSFNGTEEPNLVETMDNLAQAFGNAVAHTQVKAEAAKENYFSKIWNKFGNKAQTEAEISKAL